MKFPLIDSGDPARKQARTGGAGPIMTKSKADMADPGQAILLRDNDGLIIAKSATDEAVPRQA